VIGEGLHDDVKPTSTSSATWPPPRYEIKCFIGCCNHRRHSTLKHIPSTEWEQQHQQASEPPVRPTGRCPHTMRQSHRWIPNPSTYPLRS